ncbi:MAG: hypothetical protein U9O98_11655 [Asgard group archaeon]|nr:hypothetical protein [Asgard group archaeon]
MSNLESGKASILKFVPKEKIKLREYLQQVGLERIDKHTILVNGRKTSIEDFVEKNDEIIVLPILRGG